MTDISQDARTGYGWQPVFDHLMDMAQVSDDSRGTLDQMAHLAGVVARMNVARHEAAQIVEALQLCERICGYTRMSATLGFVAAVVDSAVALTGTTISLIALQRGYRNAGLLIGHLVEEHLHIDLLRRHFPDTGYLPRSGSPYVEFEDCQEGVLIASRLGQLDESVPSAVRPFCVLATVFRRGLGVNGLRWLEETATSAGTLSRPLKLFAGVVSTEVARAGLRLPFQWQLYIRTRSQQD